jgi:hypothetical protein
MNNNYIFLEELSLLESLTNINIFKKKETTGVHNDYKLRDSKRIINDCTKMKKKKLLLFSNELKSMSGGAIVIDKIKTINEKTLFDIDNLDKIIDIINYNTINDRSFIEIYSN